MAGYDFLVGVLTRSRIIDTAIAVADDCGFDAVTLRRVAGELGVHVTSLYNHVPTKEAVTDGIVERLIEEAGLPTEPVGWEPWVRQFYDSMGQVAAAHPGAVAALQRRPVQGKLAWAPFEIGLQAFARAGLDPAAAYWAMKSTAMLTLSMCAERALEATGIQVETDLEDIPADLFPMLGQVRDAADNAVAAWDFALEVLVLGLRSQIRHRRTPSSERKAQ